KFDGLTTPTLCGGTGLAWLKHDLDRHADCADDLPWIAPDHLTVLLEDVGLVLEFVERADEPVRDVRVLCGQQQRALFAAAADQDLGPAGLDWPRRIQRTVDLVVAPGEARALLGEHQSGDVERFAQTVHAFAHRWERDAVARVLIGIPGGADSEYG